MVCPLRRYSEQPLLQLFPRDLQMARDIVQDSRKRPDLERIVHRYRDVVLRRS